MADFLPPLVGRLVGDITGFAAKMGEATAIARAETGASATAFNGLASIGKAAFLGLGAAAVIGGGMAVKMAGDYESATNRLVTSAGEQRDSLNLVKQGMLDMAGQVGYSAMDLAKAMYIVESAGQHGADGLTVLRAAAEGAKAENADLAKVADAVTSALQDYHLKSKDAAQVTTTLVAAVSQGKTTFEELTGSLHSVLPVASAAHISLADITAAVASMTVHGMSADQATQNLAHTIQHLQTVTAPQGKELAALGLSARQLSDDLGTKGLTGTLAEISNAIQQHMGADGHVVLQLTDALKKLPPEVQKLGAEAAAGTISMGDYAKATKGLSVEAAGQAAGFATLLKATHGIGQDQKSGADVMQTYAAALKAATGDSTTLNTALMLTGENGAYTASAVKAVAGATTEAGNHVAGWASIQGTFNQKVDQMREGLGAVAITVGTQLIPYVEKAMDVTAGLAGWLAKNQQVSVPLAIAIGGVLLVAIGAYTIAMIQAAIATIAATWPLLLIVVAVAAVAAGIAVLIMHWQQVRAWIVNVAGVISGFIEQHKVLAAVIILLLGPIGLIIAVGALLITHWSQVTHWVGQVVGAVRQAIQTHQALAVIVAALVLGPLSLMIGAAVLIVTHWRQLLSFFESLPGRIGGLFSMLDSAIHRAVTAAWNGIVFVFRAGVAGAIAIVTGFVGAVVGFFAWLYNHNYYFKVLVDSIKLTFEKARGDAVAIWTTITTWLSDRWSWVAGVASAVWGAVSSWIGARMNDASNVIRTVWSAVAGWLGGVWNQIAGAAGYAWGLVSGAISNRVHDAWNVITGIFGGLGGWFGDITGKAWSWGYNLIQSIGRGIGAAAGFIAEAVRAIGGVIADWLGFHSPTKLGPGAEADMWAPAFIRMYAGGLTAGVGTVRGAAAQLAGVLGPFGGMTAGGGYGGASGSVGAGASMSAGASAGGYSIVFNIYGATDAAATAVAVDARLSRLLTTT